MDLIQRPRRLRGSETLRKMVRETRIDKSSLIYPLFVREGHNIKEEIPSMEGQFRYSVDQLPYELENLSKAGVSSVMLFGIPDHKDEVGSGAYAQDGIVQKALREAKKQFPDMYYITDVCMCEYTSHGHCGVLCGHEVENDATLELLAKTALSHVEAGADMVAPSDMMDGRVRAYYHLPGLFEFYELYRIFLPLFREHREYFYDWCDIGSIYGAPPDCIWGGGRVSLEDHDAREVLALLQEYDISARLTFSNSLLREEHLSDRKCNELCALFAENATSENGVIVHSELLLQYLKSHYPELYPVSSTTKVLTDFEALKKETDRDDFRYVVPDFRLNKAYEKLNTLTESQKDKVEFLCNECCYFGCKERKECYEAVSRRNLGEESDFSCTSPGAEEGYRFSKAMKNPGFISVGDIQKIYLPMGFSNYKIEGRGLGSALVLEFLLYYMTKPEYQLQVREEIYLDNMLDLF